jgi:hypothetical protein
LRKLSPSSHGKGGISGYAGRYQGIKSIDKQNCLLFGGNKLNAAGDKV